MSSGSGQVRRLSFDGESGVVPLARDFTRQALYAWGWLPAATADQRAAAEDVLLVVSELVTNACLHAEGPDELWISCDSKVIRIEVSDRGAGQPAPRTPHRAGRPGGHGMFIVQRLCLDWGVVRTPGGDGQDGVGGAGRTRVGPPAGVRPSRRSLGLARCPAAPSGRLLLAASPRLPTVRARRIPTIRRALCLPSSRPRAYLDGPI